MPGALVYDVVRGLLNLPVTGVQLRSQTIYLRVSDLQESERLQPYYHQNVHRLFPVWYWPKFQRHFAIAMEEESAQSLPDRLGCGILRCFRMWRTCNPRSWQTTRSAGLFNKGNFDHQLLEDDVSTNQAIVAFLPALRY